MMRGKYVLIHIFRVCKLQCRTYIIRIYMYTCTSIRHVQQSPAIHLLIFVDMTSVQSVETEAAASSHANGGYLAEPHDLDDIIDRLHIGTLQREKLRVNHFLSIPSSVMNNSMLSIFSIFSLYYPNQYFPVHQFREIMLFAVRIVVFVLHSTIGIKLLE